MYFLGSYILTFYGICPLIYCPKPVNLTKLVFPAINVLYCFRHTYDLIVKGLPVSTWTYLSNINIAINAN